MARAGIDKSEVQKARDALRAQGINPSIDAVRVALGHTGSKTTIHRYLCELDAEEGQPFGAQVAVSEALQDLVARLAERLHQEAEERLSEAQAQHTALIAQRDATITKLQQEATELHALRQQLEAALLIETEAHARTQQDLQATTILSSQREQQVTDLKERQLEQEAHRQSLEDKHSHAREALEHFRQASKEQRDLAQRQYEQQIQQLQAEGRSLNQTLIAKQTELTQTNQELARIGSEWRMTRMELQRSELACDNADKACDAHRQRIAQLEVIVATLNERLQQATASRDAAWRLLRGSTDWQESTTVDTATRDLFDEGRGRST